MNDLEHDLRELFDERAAGVDVPGLAPKQVLKRGRRRQVGMVVTGLVACLAALAIAAAAIGQTRHPAVIPTGNGLPARSTSIGGVPVTAPAGWTLVDDYPLASVMATTNETCTFSGSGSTVEGNGSPVEGSGSSAATSIGEGSGTSTQTCTGSTKDYPAGIPILQMANFEIPLGQSVCGQGNYMDQAALPADGVAVYVASFPGGITTQDVLDACPGASTITDGVSLETFADKGVQTVYGGVVVAGGAASDGDIAQAQTYLKTLGGIRIDATTPPLGPGPGYVMATGSNDNASWRLEAGITSYPADGSGPGLGAIMVTTTSDGAGARTVDLPIQQHVADGYIDLGTRGVVQFGTAAADVTGIEIALPSGATAPATMLAWPPQIGSAVGLPNLDGSLWFASTPVLGSVHATFPSAPTSAPTAEVTQPPTSDKLDARMRPGNGFVVSGHDFGHDWQIQLNEGQHLDFYLGGASQPMSSFNFMVGNETQIDVPGGTFIVSMRDPTVSRLTVTTDATDQQPSTTIVGRWLPIQDPLGDQGLLWVLPLPGSGTGTEQANTDLPTFVSWPSSPLRDGTLLSGASDGVVSWALTYRNGNCVVLQTIGTDPGNSGTSGCLPPWTDNSNTPLVGGVYGSSRATAAIVLTHRPRTTVTSSNLHDGELQCDDLDFESSFAGTTICVFPVEVGRSVTIDMSQSGGPLNHPITVEAEPSRLNLIQGDANTGTSSSSGAATAATSP